MFRDVGVHGTEKDALLRWIAGSGLRIYGGMVSALKEGKSVVIHSAIGPEDPRISKMRKSARELGISWEKAADLLAETLGRITRKVILASGVRRAVLAGGG